MLRNDTKDGRLRFTPVTVNLGPGMRIVRGSRGASLIDLHDDGDLDLVIVNLNAPPDLLVNQRGSKSGHWVQLRLTGNVAKKSNRDAVGAHIWVTSGDRKQFFETKRGQGFWAATIRASMSGWASTRGRSRSPSNGPTATKPSTRSKRSTRSFRSSSPDRMASLGKPPLRAGRAWGSRGGVCAGGPRRRGGSRQGDLGVRRGCAFCCHLPVMATASEAAVIGPHVADWARVEAHGSAGGRCPLLGDDDRCTVYDWRPLKCRAHTSTSRDACEAGEKIDMDGWMVKAVEAILAGMNEPTMPLAEALLNWRAAQRRTG